MELLVIDGQGRITIPPEISTRHGWQPGDQVALLHTDHGLVVCREGIAWMDSWWNSLTDEEKIEAKKEAEEYEALSEEERDAIWNEGNEELERWLEGSDEDEDDKDPDDEGDKGDEYELSTVQRSTG